MIVVSVAKTVLFLTITIFCSMMAVAQEHDDSHSEIELSPDLTSLLQAEMGELLVASQDLVLLIVSGDWNAIQHTSKQIRDSYVMAQNLSDLQREELKHKLPDHFKRLDNEFHNRAEKLRQAAVDEDMESVNFHYFRLLETCASCHAEFASSRFPGFVPGTEEGHQH